MNEILVCDKCRHIKLKTFVPKLEKLAPNVNVKVGCKKYCGPCKRNVFIYINGRYVTAPNEEEALEKVKQFIK